MSPSPYGYAPNEERPDCWNWGRPSLSAGYGLIPRTKIIAHRFVYEALIGPIPSGLEIDHLCRNRNCVNPTHMEVVTHRENSIRGADATLKRRYTRKKVLA